MLKIFSAPYRKWVSTWLYRSRAAEPGETLLSQRRVFIVPSRAGLAFCAMLIVLFIASVNYNLSLGFGFTFLIAACAVIDMHFTFRNLAYLYLLAGRTQPVFSGEEAQFELHLINRRKHGRYAIWLNFLIRDMPEIAQPADIAANATHSVTLAAPASTRGWMQAPRVRLYTRFPLGLLYAWSYWQPDARTLVYPRPEDDAPSLPSGVAEHGDGRGPAGHDDFAGIRNYQSGDAMKHLAWRQIAKIDLDAGGSLVTKHFEGGAASELTLDLAQLPRTMEIEAKLSRMTRWVLEAEVRGLPYAFRAGSTVLSAAIGPAHQAACLQALALYETT
jgi:uncharacterized protein (DUF58 family)